jgi:hypothetical protein
MRSHITTSVVLVSLACALAGCSTTSKSASTASKSWWPFGSKNKAVDTTTSLATNAPSPPGIGATAATTSPTVSMPSAAGAAPNYNGTQYPVTPYPSTGATAASAYGGAPAYGAAPAGATMPPAASYSAAPAGSNPYVAATTPPASPYATPHAADPTYTANQYSAAPYPGGPSTGAAMPGGYTR